MHLGLYWGCQYQHSSCHRCMQQSWSHIERLCSLAHASTHTGQCERPRLYTSRCALILLGLDCHDGLSGLSAYRCRLCLQVQLRLRVPSGGSTTTLTSTTLTERVVKVLVCIVTQVIWSYTEGGWQRRLGFTSYPSPLVKVSDRNLTAAMCNLVFCFNAGSGV